ncbi:hypothetical protein [Glycomyces tarimensis]
MPVLFGGNRVFRAELAKIDAIDAWAESFQEVITAAAGLEQAIQRSAAYPPPAIKEEVRQLAEDLRGGHGDEGLRAFAAKLDDEMVDLVAMALIVAAKAARIWQIPRLLAERGMPVVGISCGAAPVWNYVKIPGKISSISPSQFVKCSSLTPW